MSSSALFNKLLRIGHDFISWVIVLNFISIALSTISFFKPYSNLLIAFDNLCLWIFIVEITVRIIIGGKSFFVGQNCGWNYFDLIVTGVSALSAIPAFSALRIARMLRLFISLRMISSLKHLRILTSSLMKALPSVGWLGLLLLFINLIYTVMATIMFGELFPERYGTLVSSFYAMIELMTMEGWTDVAREVMDKLPWAWIFFLSYIMIAAYVLLNAVAGVIVDGMMSPETEASTRREEEMLMRQDKLQRQIEELSQQLERFGKPTSNATLENK